MPEIKEVVSFDIPRAEQIKLTNGLPVYVVNQAVKEVSKIELLFNAGNCYEQQHLQAKMTNRMLREGAGGITGKAIAEKLDYYGASFRQETSGDYASVTLMALNKHLPHVFPLFEKIVKHPDFSNDELETLLLNNIQKLKVSLKKNEVLADRKIHEIIYGEDHPYGYNSSKEKYSAITSECLKSFHKQTYTAASCKIIVSGKIDQAILNLLEKHFGGNDWQGENSVKPVQKEIIDLSDYKHIVPIKGSVQSAIRLGKRLFNKTHPDYYGFHVLNTMLGGYFGSRLMSNIREDKGYTYGIYSGLYSYLNEGYWYVTTEAGTDVAADTIKEIYFEIERLKNELASDDELSLVKNYLRGSWLSSIDGPFKLSNLTKTLAIYNLEYDYFYKIIETINTITAEEIRQLAQTYLSTDNLHEIIVG